MLEPLVATESSQNKGNFPVCSRPEGNYPEWKPAFNDGKLEKGILFKVFFPPKQNIGGALIVNMLI